MAKFIHYADANGMNQIDTSDTSSLFAGTFRGQTTLVAGTKAISIAGVTANSYPIVGLGSQGGTVTTTVQYKGVCTNGILTITAMTSAKAINTGDTSIINYVVFN